jgi:hypothetical protein
MLLSSRLSLLLLFQFRLISTGSKDAGHSNVPRLFAHLKREGLTISVDPNDDPLGAWGIHFSKS